MTARSYSTTIPPRVKRIQMKLCVFLYWNPSSLLRADLQRLREAESPPHHFQHESRPPKSDRCHAVCKHSEQWRSLIRIVCPAFARGAPEFKIISKPRACDEGQQCETMICRCEDDENAQDESEPCKGFIKCRGNKDQHQN